MQGGRSNESLRRKLFVGGLSFKTTNESLREHFSKFGEITDAIVMLFPESQRSRGFGFVTFATDEEVENCQNNRPHVVDGKQVETKRATPREARENPDACQSVTKVFVGGIPEEVEDEEIQGYFEQFGKVVSVKRATEKDTGKKKRFAFVEFADYDDVDKAIIKGDHELGGRHVDVKKAVPKDAMGGGRGGRGGRGGGRGGWGGGAGGRGQYQGGGQWGGASGGWGQSSGGWGGGYQAGAAEGWGGASSDYSSYQSGGGAAGWGSSAGYGTTGEGYGSGGYGGGPIRPTAGAAGGYRTTPYGTGASGGYQAGGAGRGGGAGGYRGGMA